jgi:methyl-accepting chemotaxis protein
MSGPLKIASGIVTAALVVVALAIGGGSLPRPDRLASLASEAARNTREAAANIKLAVEDTEALATIADNVRSQLDASERLLDTQLTIEEASREGARRSRALTDDVDRIRKVLARLRDRLIETSRLSEETTSVADSSASSADELEHTLDVLRARFDELVGESRELNRKAHGYSELRDGPG